MSVRCHACSRVRIILTGTVLGGLVIGGGATPAQAQPSGAYEQGRGNYPGYYYTPSSPSYHGYARSGVGSESPGGWYGTGRYGDGGYGGSGFGPRVRGGNQ
jgi:hypothetical protein